MKLSEADWHNFVVPTEKFSGECVHLIRMEVIPLSLYVLGNLQLLGVYICICNLEINCCSV